MTFVHLILPQPMLADVFFAFRESNAAGKAIVAILFIGSIFAWSIMVSKFMELRRARSSSLRFLHAFRKEENPVNLFLKRQRFMHSPLYRIYESGCKTLGLELDTGGAETSELFVGRMGSAQPKLSATQVEAVRNVVDRTVNDQAMLLESNMGFLATAVSASPFLGLLGTVWGVMDSFGGMAVAGSATLGAVAPGISGALLTTVVGLLVALPSSIGYNMLTHRIRALCVQMDNFGQEFSAEVQRHFAKE